MATLYTTAVSANGRKVLALSEHLALDLEVRTVDVYGGEGQSAWYKKLNPWGKVPTLVDGEFILWESNAILVYLSECFADSALFAWDPRKRADILRWLFWETSHWQPTLVRVLAPRVSEILFPAAAPHTTSPAWEDTELVALLVVLDSVLQSSAFVCGPDLTVADFSIAGMTTYFTATKFPEHHYPGIAAWMQRMGTLPAWVNTAVAPWK